MTDPRSHIPAEGISFDEAFELMFDAVRPEAAELRRAIDTIEAVQDENERDRIWVCWDTARRDVDVFFRDELAHNALVAYQRFASGDEQVASQFWADPALQRSTADAFPAIFFRKTELNSWLTRVRHKKSNAGAPRKYDRNAVRKFVFETMADYGGFDRAADDGLACQADLEKKIGDYLEGQSGQRPAESTCRAFAREFLSEWRTESR